MLTRTKPKRPPARDGRWAVLIVMLAGAALALYDLLR